MADWREKRGPSAPTTTCENTTDAPSPDHMGQVCAVRSPSPSGSLILHLAGSVGAHHVDVAVVPDIEKAAAGRTVGVGLRCRAGGVDGRRIGWSVAVGGWRRRVPFRRRSRGGCGLRGSRRRSARARRDDRGHDRDREAPAQESRRRWCHGNARWREAGSVYVRGGGWGRGAKRKARGQRPRAFIAIRLVAGAGLEPATFGL